MNRYQGKTVLITGGGNGIGRATALRLASEGASMIVVDKDADAAARVAGETNGTAITIDVRDTQALEKALAGLEVDVLVSNAGGTTTGTFAALTPEIFQAEVALNLESAFNLCYFLMPAMIRRGHGSIVLVASVNGMMHLGNPGYSAAKAGLINLMRSLAVEQGPKGIRANCVTPGTIATGNRSWAKRLDRDPAVFDKLKKWYPVGRVGRPEDVAAAIAFLGSDEAGFVNGANLVVDGGLTAGIGPMVAEFVIEDRPAPPAPDSGIGP